MSLTISRQYLHRILKSKIIINIPYYNAPWEHKKPRPEVFEFLNGNRGDSLPQLSLPTVAHLVVAAVTMAGWTNDGAKRQPLVGKTPKYEFG